MNLSAIMHHLRQNSPISRAALAETTGLNKTTVSSLVRELIDRGFVHELGFSTASSGRPAVLLHLNPDAGCILAAEIAVDFISVIRTDFAAEVTWRHREPVDHQIGQAAILDRTLALLREALASKAGAPTRLLGLALGVPGLVDRATGTLLFAPNLRWYDVPMRAILQESFGRPALVDNEANLAALGEHYFGAARDYDDVLFITAGVGVGGGLIRGGQLYRGASGYAGEFGHMTVDPDGELCACGNQGCWETLVSPSALFDNIRKMIRSSRPSLLSDTAGTGLERLTVPLVVDAANAGDSVALAALEQVGTHLGIGVASLINALNPELVVLGGSLSVAGAFVLPTVKEQVCRRALRWSADATKIVLAQQGSDACVMGGVATVYQDVLAQPGEGGTILHATTLDRRADAVPDIALQSSGAGAGAGHFGAAIQTGVRR